MPTRSILVGPPAPSDQDPAPADATSESTGETAASAAPPPTPRPIAETGTVRVTAYLANVREGPNSQHPVLTTARRGESLPVIGRWEGWYQVRLKDTRTGWIYSNLVSSGDEAAPTPGAQGTPAPPIPMEPPPGVDYSAQAATLPAGQVMNRKTSQTYWILQEAIEAAEPGSVLLLGPGRYPGRVVFHKVLYLYGAGMDQTTLEMTRDSKDSLWLAEDAVHGRISGLEVVGGTQKLPVVEISGAWGGVLESVRIRGGRGPGILVGDTATAALRRCEFVDTGVVAIEIRGQAQPRIENCKIEKTRGGGVVILEQSKPLLLGNRLLDCGTFGLQIGDTAQPTLERNEIRGSKHDGAYVFGRAAPTLHQNQFIGNAQKRSDTANLTFDDDAAGTVTDNLIEGAEKRPGMLFTENSHPLVTNNRIRKNKAGVQFEKRSFPTLKDNQFEGNVQEEVDKRAK